MNEDQEIRNGAAERWWQFERDARTFSKDFGASTIQSLILINGGAIIALLSFLASTEIKTIIASNVQIYQIYWTFLGFSLGLIFAVVGGGVGYLNYLFLTDTQPGPAGLSRYIATGDTSGWKEHSGVTITIWVGVAAAIFSLVGFLIGCWFALQTIVGIM